MRSAVPLERTWIRDKMRVRAVRIGAAALREMPVFRQIEEGFPL